MAIETYEAVADEAAAQAVGAASPFKIQVRFLGGLDQRQKNAFKAAARRWTRVIVGDLPSVRVGGEIIDDVLILADGAEIDGPSGILGQAGPTRLRPANAGRAAFLPAKGRMTFDKADLRQMERSGILDDVIAHEMGHVLGVGTVWRRKKLLKNAGSGNPSFAGKAAMKAYRDLRGSGPDNRRVPVENTGGPATRGTHWRERVFGNELMSGFIGAGRNPLSRMTVASLRDLGYSVALGAAEPYALANLVEPGQEGLPGTHAAPTDGGIMLPNIPLILSDESLQEPGDPEGP